MYLSYGVLKQIQGIYIYILHSFELFFKCCTDCDGVQQDDTSVNQYTLSKSYKF